MINEFSFNHLTHNFWPVYETIQRYYPIGIPKREYGGIYDSFPGIAAMERIVVDTIHHENDFYQSWQQFQEQLSTELKLTVRGTTYGQSPGLSADIFLEDSRIDNFKKIKKISIALSLIGPFYTIYGVDESIFLERGNDGFELNHHAVNAYTASPYAEFEETFLQIKDMIEAAYPGYRLIPFTINTAVIRGLQVRYIDDEVCTVGYALFNQFLNVNEYIIPRGDRYFGNTQWMTGSSGTVSITMGPPQ